jgi:hypothetical protein
VKPLQTALRTVQQLSRAQTAVQTAIGQVRLCPALHDDQTEENLHDADRGIKEALAQALRDALQIIDPTPSTYRPTADDIREAYDFAQRGRMGDAWRTIAGQNLPTYTATNGHISVD